MGIRVRVLVSLVVAAWCCQAGAQARIYSCVDAKGRRLTADRPIMECLDREQKQYGDNGTVKGKLPPSYTAEERAIEDEKHHQAQVAAQRQAEFKRRDRVLLNRYPNAASHQREREASLARLDDAIGAGEQRLADLARQRKDLEQQSSAAKTVAKSNQSKRQLDENAENLSAQQRLLAAQRDERQRIASRFDDEFARLQVLWGSAPVTGATATAARPPASSVER
ncbi:MAG TPA: DUF4124 domain-containing protein [Ramlibacter sp.]